MHSATEAALKKLDLIDFLPDSEGKPSLASFQGRRVVVDDSLPILKAAQDYGIKHLLAVANPDSQQLSRQITEFPAITDYSVLLDDIRMHPKRYINVSVFGRKDKSTPLTAPLEVDSVSLNAPKP